jgi:hypothetical protein
MVLTDRRRGQTVKTLHSPPSPGENAQTPQADPLFVGDFASLQLCVPDVGHVPMQ